MFIRAQNPPDSQNLFIDVQFCWVALSIRSDGTLVNFHNDHRLESVARPYFRCNFTDYNRKSSVSSRKHNFRRFYVCFTHKYNSITLYSRFVNGFALLFSSLGS
jgi:hypothetical protein